MWVKNYHRLLAPQDAKIFSFLFFFFWDFLSQWDYGTGTRSPFTHGCNLLKQGVAGQLGSNGGQENLIQHLEFHEKKLNNGGAYECFLTKKKS